MAPAPLALLVIVISGTCARSCACANQSALLAVNQCSGASTNRSANTDPLCGFTLSRLRIVTSPSLRRRTVERECQRQQANRQSQRDRAPHFLPIHKSSPPNTMMEIHLEVSAAWYQSDGEIHPKEAWRRCQGSDLGSRHIRTIVIRTQHHPRSS